MFNPTNSFFDLRVVRWSAGVLIFISLASAGAIYLTGDYVFSPTAEGFNRLLADFKFPIGVLAMLIPVMALLATNHRSEQTREQIRVAESQNKFVNHFKHIEEFESFLENFDLFEASPRELHKLLFPKSADGDFDIDKKCLTGLERNCSLFINARKKIKNGWENEEIKLEIERCIKGLKSRFKLKYKADFKIDNGFVLQASAFGSGDKGLDLACREYWLLLDGINKILEFGGSYSSPEIVKDIIGFEGSVNIKSVRSESKY